MPETPASARPLLLARETGIAMIRRAGRIPAARRPFAHRTSLPVKRNM